MLWTAACPPDTETAGEASEREEPVQRGEVIGGDGERSLSLENPLWSGTTRVAIFMPAGVASGDTAQNYLLEPLSEAAATQLYRKDTMLRVTEWWR
jgi:hypothetical protein